MRKTNFLQTGLAIVLVFLLLYAGNTVDVLSGLTKPIIIAGLKLVGVTAVDESTHLVIGQLNVPWTGDCAGLNILAIMVGVTLWANRALPVGASFWVRLLLAFPVAFLANLLRIFTLIGLRWWIYPAVESPQLHYFIGFLWVLPFLAFFVPSRRQQSSRGLFWLETVRIAAVLSLVAPFVAAPGGVMVTICSLLLLTRHRWHGVRGALPILLYVFWFVAALFIASARMESLWIPWILSCPGFLDWRPSRLLPMPLLLLGTIPLAAMHPVLWWLVLPAMLWEAWQLLRPGVLDQDQHSESLRGEGPVFAATLVFHIFPFVAAVAAVAGGEDIPPPAGLMAMRTKENAYVVRAVGQPANISCFWYEPNEGGRHHTLEVCLQYRGVKLKPTGEPEVMTDGSHWMTEYFLLGDGTLADYREYLRRTFWPFSSSGVHLIYMAPAEELTPAEFRKLVTENARQIRSLLPGGATQP